MPNPEAQQLLAAARELLSRPLDFDEFLARLPAKDRANAEKRVALLEASATPNRAVLWRRLACVLMTLAPDAVKLVGKQTVQFYAADGKYRMQVFALEDLQDGSLTVYCPDVLKEAVEAGLLASVDPETAPSYVIPSAHEPLQVDRLDGASRNPGDHFKDMIGWNRKALRLTLAPSSSPAQFEAVELLCAIAARRFVRRPVADAAPTAKA